MNGKKHSENLSQVSKSFPKNSGFWETYTGTGNVWET